MKSTESVVSREDLKPFRLFKDIADAALDLILEQGLRLESKKGDPILYENRRGGIGLYLILSGLVEVLRQEPQLEAPVHVANLQAGDCFGEYSLIDGSTTSAAAKALEDCLLFFIPRGAFIQVLNGDPQIGKTFYFNLSLHLVNRLRQNDTRS
ncbi:MAG: cyclic nucleotide-binding domain-containing protein [Pseudomonadota bacterium]